MSRSLRLSLFLCIGLLLGASASFAFAGYAQLKAPANVGGAVGARTTAGAVSANNGSFSLGYTTNVGGRAVTMPASASFAANAAQIAVGAIRLTPTGLIGGAVAAWLLTEGLEWIDGQWKKSKPGETVTKYAISPYYGYYADTAGACNSLAVLYPSGGHFQVSGMSCQHDTATWWQTYHTLRGNTAINTYQLCSNGQVAPVGGCAPVVAPAVDQDFAPLAASPLPDGVANELAPQGVPLPIQEPVFNPEPVIVPLSNPYPAPAPKTGTVRDVAKLTPAPGEKAKVEVIQQPLDENGQPVPEKNPDGTANPAGAPEEKPDFCVEHPDASACMELDEVEDGGLEDKEDPFSLNPVGGFGADSAACPAPQTLFTRGGQAVVWEWTKFCQFSQGIRPLVIGFAWLAAIAMVVSVGRRA